MKEVTREMIQNQIEKMWGGYTAAYMELAPEERKAFLKKQGYARLSGLLGHVIAWWELGKYTIEQILVEPDFKNGEIDVDLFNARAVERFCSYNDQEIVEAFETMRLTMLDFVDHLPNRAFANKRINERLYIDFVDHFEEHR